MHFSSIYSKNYSLFLYVRITSISFLLKIMAIIILNIVDNEITEITSIELVVFENIFVVNKYIEMKNIDCAIKFN